jgi:membrane fusion protein (multidrug efflux system)
MSDDKSPSSEGEQAKAPIPHTRQVTILAAALAFAGILSIGFYLIWKYEDLHPSTNDAYLHAHYVWISPQLNGQVSKLFVDPNQFVKAGEPLFEIDPRQYQQALIKAENQLLLVHHEVEADGARVDSARARLAEEQAELETAQQYAQHFQQMVKSGAAAELDTIHYVNAVIETKGRVAEAKAGLDEALINQGNLDVRAARVASAQADVELAKLNLEWTRVLAPADGYVTQFSLRVGDVVKPQEQLFPFVESGNWWVEANFKETDVALIEPGMRVIVTVDAYADKEFEGRVESLSRGAAASFSLLPPQNTTGNWVKVTQRIPVRIQLMQQDPKYPFRLGASVTASVDIDAPATKSDKSN